MFGLSSVVALLSQRLVADGATTGDRVAWAEKGVTTFSDAITTVRRWLWRHWVLGTPGHDDAFAELPKPFTTGPALRPCPRGLTVTKVHKSS